MIGLILALFALCAQRAAALDPDRVQSQYSHDHWGSDRGLAGEVHAITQTADGYLWVGTDKGLYRFDGIDFRLIRDQGPAAASISDVTGLTVNSQSDLIVRLPERNLLRYSHGRFENLLNELTPRELAVTKVSRGKDGDILVAGLFHGVLSYREGRFETIAPVTSLPTSPILSMAQSADGKIWLGTSEAGVFYIDRGQVLAVRGELPSRKINTILPDGSAVWIGSEDGVARWDGTAIKNDGVPVSLRHTHVLAFLKDRQSNLWVGSTAGLFRVNSGTVAQLDQGKAVNALFEDQEGNLWVGGAWGLDRWRDGSFVTYGKPEGLPSDHNGPVFPDADGRIWFAPLEGGLYWLRGGRVTRVAALAHDIVYSITGRSGDLWVGRRQGGLTHLREERGNFTEKTFTHADGLAQNSVYSVYQSRDGAIWAGTLNGGVSRYRDGAFTTYATGDSLGSNTVSSILEGSDGTMWFATPNGLRAFSKNQWRGYTSKDGLPSDEVTCVFEDSNGILWIGTSAGLAFLRRGAITIPRAAPEPLQHAVLGIAQDKAGSLWIATSDHIVRTNREKLSEGALGNGDFFEYATGDGLRSVNAIRRDRSVVADAQGAIWFSLDTGLSVVNPSRLAANSVPAFAHIEAVSADSAAIDVNGPVRIPAGTRRITFAFSGGNLAGANRVRFRYQLFGYDPDWSPMTTAREVSYTNIAPGSYRFRVSAMNNRGIWNEAGATLSFAMPPRYYQTGWFRFLNAAAILAFLGLLYQLRLRQMRRQFHIRMEERVHERTRIARDLHDTLLQSFQGVLMKFSAARYLLPDRPEHAGEILDGVLDEARAAVIEAREAVQGLRSSTVLTNDLARAIGGLGEELAAAPDAPRFQLHVEGAPRDLPPLIRDEVYRIGCEAVRNAFTHSRAQVIEVEIRYDPRQFRLRIRDDGQGMEADILSGGGRQGHHGLPGMYERADLTGGKLSIRSQRDFGTQIDLAIPAAVAYTKSHTP